MRVQGRFDKSKNFRIPKPRYEETKRALTSLGGLQALLHVFTSGPLAEDFKSCLPEEGSNRSFGSYQLGILLIASLLSGHDSIDDIVEFDDEDLLEELFKGEIPTPKTMGNFLRKFSEKNISDLKKFMTKLGYTLRDHVRRVHPHKGDEKPYFKIDGTVHEQSGRQMEGAGWLKISGGESKFGYASQTIFDELGFCFSGELLNSENPKGNAVQILDQVLAPLRGEKIENPFEKVAHVSGDSAYLNQDFITSCQSHHASFTISAPKTINWHEHLDTREWTAWNYSEEQIKKLKRRKQTPSECYVSRWHWSPGYSKGTLQFPVIIKKEWRSDEVFGQECGSFHYHAVVTNEDLARRTYQSVIEAYRPRADVENMIKEFKLGLDAKHLPCQKKSANEVYFLFVLIAQNLVRWAAILEQPDKPHFSKKIRRKLIFSPALVLKGSRQLTLKVKIKFKREVERFLEAWGSEPVTIPLYFSTA